MSHHTTRLRARTATSAQPRLVTVTALVEVPQDYDAGVDGADGYPEALQLVPGTSFGIVTDGVSPAAGALGAHHAYPWIPKPQPLFAAGDRVTYVQAITREVQVHGTILASGFLTSDGHGDTPYFVYRVQLRGYTGNAGIGSPWAEICLVRGWLEPSLTDGTDGAEATGENP